jgi:ribosomal protein S12 methylthiotransferase
MSVKRLSSIYLTTLGCPKNQVDSEHLMNDFLSNGFVFVDNPDDADILLVNTCGFIKDAKEESIDEILDLAKKKADSLSECEGSTPKKLLVFGCLSQRYSNELAKEIPEIDALWGVGQDSEIISYCRSLPGFQKTGELGHSSLIEHPSINAQSYKYIKIAEGCDKKCTFCTIPSIRGKFKSTHKELILKEAEGFINRGAKELILIAQDITDYGRDLRGQDINLADLLRDLTAIDGDFWIRLLYLYPTSINDELLELIADNDKICKYLDIPLQHSQDRMLRLMGRRGTKKEYIKLLHNIRRRVPGVTLRTTFIIGFPSETEEEFQSLMDFIEEIRFDRLGVFKYSKEEGTAAERIRGHIPEKVKKRRYDEIMRRQAGISLEKNKELTGKRFKAVVDEADGNAAIARLYCHAPEIDGAVIISKIDCGGSDAGCDEKIESFILPGVFVEVEIIEAYDYDLRGRIINRPNEPSR